MVLAHFGLFWVHLCLFGQFRGFRGLYLANMEACLGQFRGLRGPFWASPRGLEAYFGPIKVVQRPFWANSGGLGKLRGFGGLFSAN